MKKTVIGFVLSIVIMLVLGIVMLFSTGAFAGDAHGDPVYFVKRQAMWMTLGVVACVAAACTDYHLWQKHWKWVFAFAVVMLAACFLFPKINGAHRWIKVAGFSFQPSEIGKVAAVAFLAAWFAERPLQVTRNFLDGFVYPLAIVGIIMGLIAMEVDLGTTALIGATAMFTMFVAGTRLSFLTLLAGGGLSALAFIAISMPQRMARLTGFMDLEAHKSTSGYQQWEALIALASGGFWGLGLGNGRQKMQYLPFAHTDFIFPMIGEELGLVFTLLVVFCYIAMIVCGIMIAMNARDRFGALFSFALVVMMGIQAALNIGVTTALLPNKGIALPFISYGGSSLLFSMLAVGILINIYRQGETDHDVKTSVRIPTRVTPRI
jgi:cell division protein FtsW